MAKYLLMVGHPVAGVKSPALFNRRLEDIGASIRMRIADVLPERVPGLAIQLRTDPELLGIVTTTPHKAAFAGLADDLGSYGRRLGVANALRRTEAGRLEGEMFDCVAMQRCVAQRDLEVQGKTVGIIGFGAAGRACALVLGAANPAVMMVHDRIAMPPALLDGLGCEPWPVDGVPAADIDIIVNAAAPNLGDGDALPIDPRALRPGQTVMDLTAGDPPGGIAMAALARGCRLIDGRDFAAAQFEALWEFFFQDMGLNSADLAEGGTE